METKEALKESRGRKLVSADKFDRHMKRARVNDNDARRQMFIRQTEQSVSERAKNKALTGSIY